MARYHRGPDLDRLIVARLTGTARRHAGWRQLTDAETAPAVTELREIAGGRADLRAETAGVMLGPARAISTSRWPRPQFSRASPRALTSP